MDIHLKKTLNSSESNPSNLDAINKHFDFDYLKSMAINILDPIDKYYFRSRLINFETVPERNNPDSPVIYISNHSGMTFPWDAIIFVGRIFQKNNFQIKNSLRALTAPALSASRYMQPYFVDDFWRRVGGVDATLENFDTMMNLKDSNVLIYPEGIAGIRKCFDKRYQLRQFSSSFIRMAIKYKTDIVPVSVVNGEYINPYSYRNDELNKLVNKIGIPFLPVGPITPLVALQPWIYYFGMPSKLTYFRGKTIKVYEMTDKPIEKLKKKEIHFLRDTVQFQMQTELDMAVEEYGKDPYWLEELGDTWRDNLDKLLYILPSGWPVLFQEHERRYAKEKSFKIPLSNESYFQAVSKTPENLFYGIPLLGIAGLLKWKGIF